MLNNVKQVVEDYGLQMTADMIAILKSRGSKHLIDEIDNDVKSDMNSVMLEIRMPAYGYYSSEGRQAGGFPPLKSIEDWLGDRNMNLALAFPIARKIATLGTKANASHFLAEFKLSNEFEANVLQAYSKDIQELLKQEVDKLNKM